VGVWKVRLLNTGLKIELRKLNVAYERIRDIKGYHIHVWLSSNSRIEKSYGGYASGQNLCMA
jgi:hypothetical protein